MWDVFICHATEDKDSVARPLAKRLESAGVKVWLDETALRLGDSLRKGIDEGLARSRYGIVILSPAFFAKNWTQAELGALTAKETLHTQVVLPVWYGMGSQAIRERSPLLADRVAARWEEGVDAVVARILEVVRPSGPAADGVADAAPIPELRSLWPQVRVTGPASMRYNSFAWAAGDVESWWYPGPNYTWPSEAERIGTMGAFVRAFESLGYRACADGTVEGGYEKVAIHADEAGTPTHAARQLRDGSWTSKLGALQLVQYDDVSLLTPLYGRVTAFMRRPLRSGDA